MRVVGLGGGLHDFSACLVEDGKLVRAIEQERITRVRHACNHTTLTKSFRTGDFRPSFYELLDSGSFPEIGYCLDGESVTSLDALTHATRGLHMVPRALEWPLWWPPLWGPRHLKGISHHLAHAASAFLVSPYEEALTVVIDAFGSRNPAGRGAEASSIWLGRDRELTPIRIDYSERVFTDENPKHWPGPRVASLGVFYSDITLFCGFSVLDAGKTMGLAPWGSDSLLAELSQYVQLADDGQVLIDPRYLLFLREWGKRQATLQDEDRFQHEADLAYAGQKVLEEAVLHLVRFGCERTKLRRLCLAGGVALNAVANARILEETPIEEIYIQPAANDAGIAIGAAFHTYYAKTNGPREFVMEHAYLGRDYSPAEIDAAVANFQGRPELERPEQLYQRTVDLLTEGKILAWFQGGSEFGPRALGNRSILADPRSKPTWQRVNDLKQREWFRPLAPAVLSEHQSEYFELETPTPFMVIVGRTRVEKRDVLGAVTHVDGSARLQTVEKKTNPRFHALISAFAERTGVPVLMNTSFNIQGPIVETPAEAVATFLGSELDALVVGDYLLQQPDKPS